VKKAVKIALIALGALVLLGGGLGALAYRTIITPATLPQSDTGQVFLHVPTGSPMQGLQTRLSQKAILAPEDTALWARLAAVMHFDKPLPGRYRIEKGMSLLALTRLLRSGRQTPVRLVVNLVDSVPEVAGLAARRLEADSQAIVAETFQTGRLQAVSLGPETAGLLFIPNTYELYWNTSAEAFVDRMQKEFRRFWDGQRTRTLEDHPLSREEVGILASIVQKETNHYDEMDRIAGVYINRLKQGMLLQADPTVKYAVGDPTIRRVLTRHTEVESPYNTYRHSGLPPGPITIPDPRALDAVLGYERHNYLYFCAKPDGSGYHAFATNLREHNRNARAYRRALNQRGIYR
jgi:UPF0755 protein